MSNDDIVRKARRNETAPDEHEASQQHSPRASQEKENQKKKRGGLFGAWGSGATGAAQVAFDSAGSAARWMEEADAEKKAKEAVDIATVEDSVATTLHGPIVIDARLCQLSSGAAALEELNAQGTDLASVRYT